MANTYITGLDSNRLLTRKVFNEQLKPNHFVSDVNKAIKKSEIEGLSWSSDTVGYSIIINNSSNYTNDKCIKCGDIVRTDATLIKTYQYDVDFTGYNYVNGLASIDGPGQWRTEDGETYITSAPLTFSAYGDGGLIFEQKIGVQLTGLKDKSGNLYLSNVIAAIDSVSFTTTEANLCRYCELTPYDGSYIVGISFGSYYYLTESESNKNSNLFWNDITFELDDVVKSLIN